MPMGLSQRPEAGAGASMTALSGHGGTGGLSDDEVVGGEETAGGRERGNERHERSSSRGEPGSPPRHLSPPFHGGSPSTAGLRGEQRRRSSGGGSGGASSGGNRARAPSTDLDQFARSVAATAHGVELPPFQSGASHDGGGVEHGPVANAALRALGVRYDALHGGAGGRGPPSLSRSRTAQDWDHHPLQRNQQGAAPQDGGPVGSGEQQGTARVRGLLSPSDGANEVATGRGPVLRTEQGQASAG